MERQKPQYISASRRCDLPRFQTGEFFDSWREGAVRYDGGYGRSYTVSLRPEHVRGYVFWSKDFAPFIAHRDFAGLIARDNAVFHFTLNDSPDLEPALPSVEARLETMIRLCERVGPERIFWRFDPICGYIGADGKQIVTDRPFFTLLPEIARTGIRRCYFSFMSDYAKLRDRPARFLSLDLEHRIRIATEMAAAAREMGLALYNCCNPEISSQAKGVLEAHCIDEGILRGTDRFGKHGELKPKPSRDGCGCFESRDIGSYDPACPHGCLYCYANPLISGQWPVVSGQ
jgi:hypothetical protein